MDRAPLAIIAIALATLVSCSNPAQAEIDRGDGLLTANKVDEAYAAYDAALKLDPDNPAGPGGRGCARNLADLAAARHGRPGSCRWNSVLESYSGHRCRAETLRASGDLEAALIDATKAVELDASVAYGHVTLGNVLDELGRTAEAIAAYDKAIELEFPPLANAYNQRSVSRTRSGDDEGAAADVDKAIELDPDYGAAYAVRALARVFEGDCERALADAEKAVALEPDFPSGYSARALCRGEAGDLDGALADADKAIELGRADFFAFYSRGLVRPRARRIGRCQGRPAAGARTGAHTRPGRRGPVAHGGVSASRAATARLVTLGTPQPRVSVGRLPLESPDGTFVIGRETFPEFDCFQRRECSPIGSRPPGEPRSCLCRDRADRVREAAHELGVSEVSVVFVDTVSAAARVGLRYGFKGAYTTDYPTLIWVFANWTSPDELVGTIRHETAHLAFARTHSAEESAGHSDHRRTSRSRSNTCHHPATTPCRHNPHTAGGI